MENTMSKNVTKKQQRDLRIMRNLILRGKFKKYLTWTTDGFLCRLGTIWYNTHGEHCSYYAEDFAENWHRRASVR